jgi:hypothetical protein
MPNKYFHFLCVQLHNCCLFNASFLITFTVIICTESAEDIAKETSARSSNRNSKYKMFWIYDANPPTQTERTDSKSFFKDRLISMVPIPQHKWSKFVRGSSTLPGRTRTQPLGLCTSSASNVHVFLN